MTVNPRLGYGVKLRMGDGGSPTEAFAEIASIRDFTVEQQSELVEVTSHSSGAVNGVPVRDFIAGAIDGTEITIPVIYDYNEATHGTATGLRSKQGQTVNFELVEPGSSKKESFSAVVLGISRSYPVDDVMGMDVTIKPTTVFTVATDT